jgi:uncharacterized membrane protein YeiH
MSSPRVISCVCAVGTLALGSVSVSQASAAQAPSCVGQFVMVLAPHSSGAFGGFVRDVARTTEPNLGVGDVAPDATSDHSDCS